MCTLVVFTGLYYKMDGAEKLAKFLDGAKKYVPPQAPYELPPSELLPKRRTATEAKQMFPKPIELRGYCPVTYFEGNCRSVSQKELITFSAHVTSTASARCGLLIDMSHVLWTS